VNQQTFRKRAKEIKNELVKWRRHLHRHPELSFKEKETAAFAAGKLDEFPGIKVHTGAGYPTSVIGELSSGKGPVIAIRADMDALPIQEKNECIYKSMHDGVMHACGHDAHTAIGLGAAKLLSESFAKKEIQGTVKFLFQPAEEHVDENGMSGAAYMVQAGVLDNVDAVIALHMSPENKLGEVKIHDGYSMAGVDVFKGMIYASGGHGAYPHLGTDPIWLGSQVLQAIYGITSRFISPLEPSVISIGKIKGGAASNVIPSKLEIEGTIRSFRPKIRHKLLKEVKNAFSIAKSLGGDYQLNFIQEDPPLRNDKNINSFIIQSIQGLYPAYVIMDVPFGLGGEDFAHMTSEIPGAMFFLGCRDPDKETGNLHTPYFDIDEQVLPIGSAVLAETVRRFLTEGG